VQDLAEKADKESRLLKTKTDEINLLNQVLKFNCMDYDSKEDSALARENEAEEDDGAVAAPAAAPIVSRKTGTLGSKSGAGSSVYAEFNA
jgi:hypothetical protein